MGIPVSTPILAGNEKKYLEECITSGWISSEGPFVRRFEQEFADYIGVSQAGCAVCNGTAALETALYAIGVKPGDEVIIPDFTIISCALACLRLGAVPVLVDCEPRYWGMDVHAVESKITPKTRAIMAVHIYGSPVDMDPLLDLRKRYGLAIIEDIAEAIGVTYRGKRCGSLGDVAAVSFYANKLVSCGEGGMVLSSSNEIMERARSYRNLCFGKEERFRHNDIGYNFRMTNLQAAVGCAQLEQIDTFLRIKAKNGARYAESLANRTDIRFMEFPPFASGVYWMYCIEVREEARSVLRKLQAAGIGSRPFFLGLHAQSVLKGKVVATGNYPCSDYAFQHGLYLPSGLTLTDEEIDRIIKTLCGVLK